MSFEFEKQLRRTEESDLVDKYGLCPEEDSLLVQPVYDTFHEEWDETLTRSQNKGAEFMVAYGRGNLSVVKAMAEGMSVEAQVAAWCDFITLVAADRVTHLLKMSAQQPTGLFSKEEKVGLQWLGWWVLCDATMWSPGEPEGLAASACLQLQKMTAQVGPQELLAMVMAISTQVCDPSAVKEMVQQMLTMGVWGDG